MAGRGVEVVVAGGLLVVVGFGVGALGTVAAPWARKSKSVETQRTYVSTFFFSPLAGGAGLGSIHSRGRLGGRARAKGARRDKAAAADQEAGYGSLHAP